MSRMMRSNCRDDLFPLFFTSAPESAVLPNHTPDHISSDDTHISWADAHEIQSVIDWREQPLEVAQLD